MDFEALTQRLELEAQKLKETIAVANQRLAEIEIFLRLGRRFTGQPEAAENRDTDSCKSGLRPLFPLDSTTQRDRVLEASQKLLRDGRRRTTKELWAELQSVGVAIGGLAPAQTLSTYLSREKERFISDVKRGGWTLKEFEATTSAFHTGSLAFPSLNTIGQISCCSIGSPLDEGEEE